MSAISFPHGFPAHSLRDDSEEGFGAPSAFGGSVSASGFTMNPLSAHPPRTPRASLVPASAAHAQVADIYASAAEAEERPAEVEVDVRDLVPAAGGKPRGVRREEVWREMLRSSNGRDKALKMIQYTLKTLLLLHASTRLGRPSATRLDLAARATSAAAGLSLARKCLILFNWLPPLTTILASHTPARPLLHTLLHAPPPLLLELLNAAADDGATLARLGVLTGRAGARAGRLADWCWFAGTLVALVENGVERAVVGVARGQVEGRMYAEGMSGATAKSAPRNAAVDEGELGKLDRQEYWLRVAQAKLLLDLVFVSYDVFKVKRAKAPVQTLAGLASALLSSAKLYDKHHVELRKAAARF